MATGVEAQLPDELKTEAGSKEMRCIFHWCTSRWGLLVPGMSALVLKKAVTAVQVGALLESTVRRIWQLLRSPKSEEAAVFEWMTLNLIPRIERSTKRFRPGGLEPQACILCDLWLSLGD